MPNLKIVSVKIQEMSQVQYFDAGLLDLMLGDEVIVETGRGIEMGAIAGSPREPLPPGDAASAGGASLPRVTRLATERDKERQEENREDEQRAYHVAKEKIQEHNLPMNLVSVEYLFDRSKYIIYFTADNRVDFRDLVRDLASTLHCRVELWQIGARDETKFYGGLGICGRTLCCNTFLKEFAPVTIKMAKDQSLALNPLKISGICGRLMCCLRYEHETYREARSRLPREGTTVMTMKGKGRVSELNALKESVTVVLESDARVECLADEVWLPGERPELERSLEEGMRPAHAERSRVRPVERSSSQGDKQGSEEQRRRLGVAHDQVAASLQAPKPDEARPKRPAEPEGTTGEQPKAVRQRGKRTKERGKPRGQRPSRQDSPRQVDSPRQGVPLSSPEKEAQPVKAEEAEKKKRRRGKRRRGVRKEQGDGADPNAKAN
ncbi:MAG: regulatory iron-sulfur-containing complex subunit RicT [Coprothermobacterota bacterium]|nr:regulatory iron-sulfur-containing complex subunit RicT [Coprothermobacterota bacterium]